MALIVVFLREHTRRTKGLILRRVKTFCLAGTAIFALKMTKRLTQVCCDSQLRGCDPREENQGGGSARILRLGVCFEYEQE